MADEQYSRISRRMWRDEKFRKLSRSPASARELWFYLLSCPRSTPLPGMLAVGVMGLAEDLDWTVEETRRFLAELEAAHMVRFDPEAKLIWLPKAIRHNLPGNPNTVLGWAPYWKLLPEGTFRDEAAAGIRAALEVADGASPGERRGGGQLALAFDVALGKRRLDQTKIKAGRPSKKGTKTKRKRVLSDGESLFPPDFCQEQDQEQDLDPDPGIPPNPPPRGGDGAGGGMGGVQSQASPAPTADAPALPGGRKRASAASRRKVPESTIRYAHSYALGQTDATGEPFPPPIDGGAQNVFAQVLHVYAIDGGGRPLRNDDLDAWIRESSACYRNMVPSTKFEDGHHPKRWARWLQSGDAKTAIARTKFYSKAAMAMWLEIYPKSARGYGQYIAEAKDEEVTTKIAEAVAEMAEARVRDVADGDDSVTVIAAKIMQWWSKRYLQCADPHIVAARHPLRFFMQRINAYGLPWAHGPDLNKPGGSKGQGRPLDRSTSQSAGKSWKSLPQGLTRAEMTPEERATFDAMSEEKRAEYMRHVTPGDPAS